MARLTLMGDTIDEMGFMIPLSRLFSGEVIEGLKVVPTVPASTSVTVQPGSAFIRTGAAPSHYAYPICLNTTGGETVALPAAQSQPMIVDIVAALDIPAITASPDTNNPGTWTLHAVAGTPNAVPAPPTNGQVQAAVSSKPFIRLGRMTHNAATQSSGITAVTDIRVLASGALGPGSVTPDKRAGGFAVGVISGSTLATTGVKAITGLGFKPRIVKFSVLYSGSTGFMGMAEGAMTEASQYWTGISGQASPLSMARTHSTTACIGWLNASGGTVGFQARYASLEDDGFSIDVMTANTTFAIAYEAYA